MSDAATSKGRQSTPVPRLGGVVAFGFLVALGFLILDVFVAPDDGLDAGSLQQGIAIASVIAAVPAAAIIRPVDASRVVALGGAMTVAGVATMFGGNLAGLLMAISGIPIFLVGVSPEPPNSWGLAFRLVGYAVLLILAMWLSLGDSTFLMKLVAVVFAGIVATSSLWDNPKTQLE
jgi:hypothetical protein